MTNIVPISDLKNYSEVLSSCDNGSVVYLTRNGRGKYVVQSMLEYEKMKATVQLLADLSKGIESLRTEGGLTIEEAFEGLEIRQKMYSQVGGTIRYTSEGSEQELTLRPGYVRIFFEAPADYDLQNAQLFYDGEPVPVAIEPEGILTAGE